MAGTRRAVRSLCGFSNREVEVKPDSTLRGGVSMSEVLSRGCSWGQARRWSGGHLTSSCAATSHMLLNVSTGVSLRNCWWGDLSEMVVFGGDHSANLSPSYLQKRCWEKRLRNLQKCGLSRCCQSRSGRLWEIIKS